MRQARIDALEEPWTKGSVNFNRGLNDQVGDVVELECLHATLACKRKTAQFCSRKRWNARKDRSSFNADTRIASQNN